MKYEDWENLRYLIKGTAPIWMFLGAILLLVSYYAYSVHTSQNLGYVINAGKKHGTIVRSGGLDGAFSIEHNWSGWVKTFDGGLWFMHFDRDGPHSKGEDITIQVWCKTAAFKECIAKPVRPPAGLVPWP